MSETDTYKTLEASSEGIYKEKGSKFISYAFPVKDENEIKKHLEGIQKAHFNARHICYAYQLGPTNIITRTNDAGEPTYTAGKPILGQLNANNLSNVLLVVARYFGGTLLGVGGLKTAYKKAAADALSNSHIIKKTVNKEYEITFDFLQMNEVMKILKEENLEQINRKFDLKGNLTFAVRKNKSEKVLEQLGKISNLEIKYLGEN